MCSGLTQASRLDVLCELRDESVTGTQESLIKGDEHQRAPSILWGEADKLLPSGGPSIDSGAPARRLRSSSERWHSG